MLLIIIFQSLVNVSLFDIIECASHVAPQSLSFIQLFLTIYTKIRLSIIQAKQLNSKTMMSTLVFIFAILCFRSAFADVNFDDNNNNNDEAITLQVSTLLDTSSSDDDLLSFAYYQGTCPEAEGIINRKVRDWVMNDSTLAASLMRLHFHDCSVRGCDASILLSDVGSERTAHASKTLRGFEVIDDIKKELESKCPKTVSCADILTAASRDATVVLGGPYWSIPYGRKDGKVSIEKEAELVPMGRESITDLIQFYQSKGLNVLDLVALSGAHTIGRASCGAIQDRIYDYKGSGESDSSMDNKYSNYLTRKCRWGSDYVELDAITPDKFDNQYYKNLQRKMGLLQTDQAMYTDSRTSPFVKAFAYAPPSVFYNQFAASMAKLGNVVEVVDDGEVRTNCNYVNSVHY
ncbi:Peroxidase 7 [Linum grandiflorum]